MPTLSGSVDFNQTRNEIVTDSLVLLGAFAAGFLWSVEPMHRRLDITIDEPVFRRRVWL